MLDFRKADGTINAKKFYIYIANHRDEPEVRKILNMPAGSAIAKYRMYLEANLNGAVPEIDAPSSQEFNFETGESTSSKVIQADKALNEEDLLKQHGYDPEKWKITKHQCSKWQSGVNTLYSSKIFVRPRNILENSPDRLLKAIDKALGYKPIPIGKGTGLTTPRLAGEKLLVLPIADLHFGLLAEAETSGNLYNMELAEKRLREFVQTTADSVTLSKDDVILVTFGNDYFNCDNPQGTTTKGTPQDNEASHMTVWDKGVNLGISIIEYLLEKLPCNINVANVQGNHDLQSSHAMLAALYYNYKDSKRVEVFLTSDEKARFYYRWGENLIGFGHETPIKQCHQLMSSECDDWSAHKYKTMFLGHLHQEEVVDTGKVVARRLPTLSGNSKWATTEGYVTHTRAQAFVFDFEKGLQNIINVEV